MHLYLAIRDENHAIRFEASFDADHSVWKNGFVEYHTRISRDLEDEDQHVCGLFGEDSCAMYHDEMGWGIDEPCLKALNLMNTDNVYNLLEGVWNNRPEWMKEGCDE